MNNDIIVKVGADISDLGRGMSQATQEINSFGKRIGDFGSNLQNHGQQIAGSFGVMSLAVGGALGLAVKKSADFDTAMRKAGAIAGATTEEFELMREAALKLGADTSKSASEVADAMTELAAKGFDANQVIAAMPGIIAASEASGEDLALAADTVASALNIWGLEAAEASRVADVLAMSANVSAAGIDDLGYVLKYAGGPASDLGVSLEELAAAAGIMTNAGLDGSNAGTSLRTSLLALNNPATAQAKIMQDLGLSIRDSNNEAKSLADIVSDVQKATEGMTEADRVATIAKLVGTEAVSGFLALMSAGPSEIDKMAESLRNSGGAAQEAADKMKDGIGGALEQLSGAFETLAIKIGDELVPYVQKLAEWLTGLLEKFNGLSPAVKQFIAVGAALFAGLTGLVAVFGTVLAFVGLVASGIGSLIAVFTPAAAAAGTTAAATGGLGAAMAAITGPIGIAVAAVVAIGAALVIAYNKVGWFRDMVNEAWARIKEGTRIAFDFVKQIVSDVIQAVVVFGKSQLDKFAAFWKENGDTIVNIVKAALGFVKGFIETQLGIIKGIFQVVWPLISNTVRFAWEAIKLIVGTAIDIVLGIIQAVLKVIEGDWKGAWESIKGIFENFWNNVLRFLKNINLVQTGKDIINGLIDGILSMGGALLNAAKGIVNGVKGVFTDLFNIHSPSRWMRDMIGENMIRGWIRGISGMKADVLRMASQMGEWMKPEPIAIQPAGYSVPAPNAGLTRALSVEHDRTATTNNASQPQPAYINVSLGGRDFEVFVDDVTKTQDRKAGLERKYGK